MLRALGVWAVVILSPVAVWAQPSPGHEFRVNSYTPGVQEFPAVAVDRDGQMIVVWESFVQDGSAEGIYARRLSASGQRLGPEFLVNRYTTGPQIGPSVALAPDGRGVVIWNDVGRDGDVMGVFARRVDRSGAPVGDDFQVNVATKGGQEGTAVATDDAGGFLVVWIDFASEPSISYSRRYDPLGQPTGAPQPLGAFLADSAAHRTGGGFVVVGFSDDPDIRGVLLDEGGRPLGADFLINNYTTGEQVLPSVASVGPGGFVVAWEGSSAESYLVRLYTRAYDVQGHPLGEEDATGPFGVANVKVAGREDGSYIVAWHMDVFKVFDIFAQRYNPGGDRRGAQFLVNEVTIGLQVGAEVAMTPGGQMVVSWSDGYSLDTSARMYGLLPAGMVVDPAVDHSNANGLLEPGETVQIAPAWANRDQADWDLAGSAVGFSGPGPAARYTIADATARYGTLLDNTTATCSSSGDCYRVAVAAGPRPSTHWDAVFEERLSNGASMRWPVHVSQSFTDVPPFGAFYRFIETLLHNGVTGGCGGERYCPGMTTTREQMAAFVLTAFEGPGYRPQDCATPVFSDVPAASPFCPYVEELARRGVSAGCGGGRFCPGAPVTRAGMAVFMLRTLDPRLEPAICSAPPFLDVPVSSPFCPWIQELKRRQVTAGCGGGNYCPDAAVPREQMAAFLSATFGLSLSTP